MGFAASSFRITRPERAILLRRNGIITVRRNLIDHPRQRPTETAVETRAAPERRCAEERITNEARFISHRYLINLNCVHIRIAKWADDRFARVDLGIIAIKRLRSPLLHVILKTPVPNKPDFVCCGAIVILINQSSSTLTIGL